LEVPESSHTGHGTADRWPIPEHRMKQNSAIRIKAVLKQSAFRNQQSTIE
jgi:hypothetical protein